MIMAEGARSHADEAEPAAQAVAHVLQLVLR